MGHQNGTIINDIELKLFIDIVVKHFFLKQLRCLLLGSIALLFSMQIFATAAIAAEVVDLPDLVTGDRTWVIDFAEVLSRSTENAVSQQLDKIAEATGNQVRLVTIRQVDYGQPVEEFATELFDKWFKTPEEKANQVLLLLVSEDYRTAILTGDKVKASLPEAIATSIAAETLLFPTQAKKYNQAATDGVARLSAVLAGEPDPGPPEIKVKEVAISTYTDAEETDKGSSTFIVVTLLIIATVVPMVTYFFFQGRS